MAGFLNIQALFRGRVAESLGQASLSLSEQSSIVEQSSNLRSCIAGFFPTIFRSGTSDSSYSFVLL